jgi:hypothetical protein
MPDTSGIHATGLEELLTHPIREAAGIYKARIRITAPVALEPGSTYAKALILGEECAVPTDAAGIPAPKPQCPDEITFFIRW